ncbi:hypothetical protein [Cohnella sp. GCM10012308]|uniref:hypothetical protein n=1 Tax=Cohnella sp. GCM10012308 TaxID=3317329 RepID=UPI003609F117
MELDSDTYIRYVRDQAREQGKEFFLDTGEGRDFIDPHTGMYVEDLSGWLFDIENGLEIHKFKRTPRELLHSQFDNYYLVIWTKEQDGRISIKFKSVY